MSAPLVGIVVVTYNSAGEVSACLDSLRGQEGVQPALVVVDNASSDDGVALVRARFPQATVIANPTNAGFARAVNQGLAALPPGASAVAIVNPDTVAAPGVLRACGEYLLAHPDVAVVGPRLVWPDGTLHPSCHGFLGLVNLLGEALALDRVWPRSGLGSFHLRAFAHDREATVDWIQGAFLVARPAAIAATGGFDPAFFMYSEEMDWMLRLRHAGWRTVFLPGPAVMHVGGASTRPLAGPMFVELLKSRLRFVGKHRGPLVAGMAAALIALAVLVRLVGWELAGPWLARRSATARETVRLRKVMFRAATGWALRGFPLGPPGMAGAALAEAEARP